MGESTVEATALLALYLNDPDQAEEYVKGIETAHLRMVRSLLRDVFEIAESELRARGLELKGLAFSREEAVLTTPDGPKMLRETLCVAQGLINLWHPLMDRRQEHSDRLQALIDQLDRHRPLGPDGKHGERHTATCGCEDK